MASQLAMKFRQKAVMDRIEAAIPRYQELYGLTIPHPVLVRGNQPVRDVQILENIAALVEGYAVKYCGYVLDAPQV